MTEIRNTPRRLFCSVMLLILMFLTLGASTLQAQRRSAYQQLAFRHNRPTIYLSTFTLPGQAPNEVQLAATFRIDYRMLSFKKVNKPGSAAFYTVPSLSIKVYKSPEKNLAFKEEVSVVNLESVARETWSDTVYAKNYEATTDASNTAAGFMKLQLPPGDYTYILQFSENGQDPRTSTTRNIHISAMDDAANGEVILAGSINKNGETVDRLNLVNMGNNIPYSNDFYALIHVPEFIAGKNYQLSVHQLDIQDDDTTRVKTVYEETIENTEIIMSIQTELVSENDQLYLNLQQIDDGYTYVLAQIPNHTFADGEYKIEITDMKSDKTIAQKTVHSLWLDKPASLYDIDVAIDMLRFITNEKTIERIGDGSESQEREKFNAFWGKRDPSPNTDFNELKAEYYRRIDYAYQHYSGQRTPGYETDRGRIYILYGPPENVERVYPTEGTTREIWTYKNRRFIFKATSGFGDFVLVEN